MQFTCTVSTEELVDKYNKVAAATSIIMAIAFCFTMLIYYLRQISHIQMLDYDMNTITAGDYTIELNISEAQWKEFLSGEFELRSDDH